MKESDADLTRALNDSNYAATQAATRLRLGLEDIQAAGRWLEKVQCGWAHKRLHTLAAVELKLQEAMLEVAEQRGDYVRAIDMMTEQMTIEDLVEDNAAARPTVLPG